eukprot:m.169489 g.169489  ORF g.169489 m.169489 type:complete len:92 (+) comp17241_c0_seq5:2264-2539(+)
MFPFVLSTLLICFFFKKKKKTEQNMQDAETPHDFAALSNQICCSLKRCATIERRSRANAATPSCVLVTGTSYCDCTAGLGSGIFTPTATSS